MDNSAQVEFWNGQAGDRWAAEAAALDTLLAPFIDAVLQAAGDVAGKRVLDVGCGSGALSLAASTRGADVTGVDVSKPMLALARSRGAEAGAAAKFIECDASTYVADARFDALVSRFGVMFFEAPEAAFVHLRGQMASGGRLSFACWRAMAENDWVTAPLKAALQFMEAPPEPQKTGGPGPFAFQDAGEVTAMLTAAGWRDVAATPWDGTVVMPGNSAEDTAGFMLTIGPLARLIAEQELDADKVRAALVKQLAAHLGNDGKYHLKATAWIITGTA